MLPFLPLISSALSTERPVDASRHRAIFGCQDNIIAGEAARHVAARVQYDAGALLLVTLPAPMRAMTHEQAIAASPAGWTLYSPLTPEQAQATPPARTRRP